MLHCQGEREKFYQMSHYLNSTLVEHCLYYHEYMDIYKFIMINIIYLNKRTPKMTCVCTLGA